MSWVHVSLKCNPYVINFDDQKSPNRVKKSLTVRTRNPTRMAWDK